MLAVEGAETTCCCAARLGGRGPGSTPCGRMPRSARSPRAQVQPHDRRPLRARGVRERFLHLLPGHEQGTQQRNGSRTSVEIHGADPVPCEGHPHLWPLAAAIGRDEHRAPSTTPVDDHLIDRLAFRTPCFADGAATESHRAQRLRNHCWELLIQEQS